MVPEMTGGVFWEHLHRLVAGGLVLMFGLATWATRREVHHRPLMFKACVAGIVLLLVQSVFGGITVIYELPTAVSTTHLTLAFVSLALGTVLASASAWHPEEIVFSEATKLRTIAAVTVGMVFVQSFVGGLSVGQVLLGFVSVLTMLAVVPVSVHTLVAATLLVTLVHVTTAAAQVSAPSPSEARTAALR